MREGQLAGAIQIRIERPKDGAESSVLIFGPSKDPQLAARGRELKSILGIKPDLRELKVNYGGLLRKRRRDRHDDAFDAADHARIRRRRAGAGGRCRAREGGARRWSTLREQER